MKFQAFTVKVIVFLSGEAMNKISGIHLPESSESEQGSGKQRNQIKIDYSKVGNVITYRKKYKKFAWFPKRMSNGKWIFLKKYVMVEW